MALKILLLCAAAGLLAGCATEEVIVVAPGKPASSQKAIPPGHMPPPGKCRIWYHGRPPGLQPPPGDCRELRHQVPAGASLIRG